MFTESTAGRPAKSSAFPSNRMARGPSSGTKIAKATGVLPRDPSYSISPDPGLTH